MSRKRRNFSAQFKAKVVLELLEGEKTLNEIASKYEILPKSLQQWKKQFLENAVLAFDKSAVVKEYKEEIESLKKEKEAIAKKLGEVIVEKEWLEGKLCSLDLSIRRDLIDKSEGVQAGTQKPSLNRQLQLLRISKTAHYYTPLAPFRSKRDKELLDAIDEIHTEYPYYGTRRMIVALKQRGIEVGRKRIRSAFAYLGIEALYPKPKTTKIAQRAYKYPYLLQEYKNDDGVVEVKGANEVWSGDITYVRLAKGYAYLAVIIDWYTKKIIAHKLSTTMDVTLTTSVLKEALAKYPKPKIFNSDQGTQYTAQEHIQILKDNGIAISMDAKGRSIDNIAIERFFRTLKYEEIYPKGYKTIKEARDGIDAYIKIYNQKRIHSAIGYKTPDEVYNQWLYSTKSAATDTLQKKVA